MTPNPRLPGRRFLHSPGPTPLPEAVLQAMGVQPMDLADPRVDDCITACEEGLQRLMATTGDVFIYASNGHGVWEAVVENVADVGASVLVPGTGVFSEGWAVQTEALGRRVVRTPVQEGGPLDAAAVEQALREDRDHLIQAVLAVHTDTSSSVTCNLAAVKRAVDAAGHPALLVADVVASLGAEPFAMDALGVDVALGASQKGLMCPPGAGFVAVNKRAFARAEANPAPRFYWDWVHRRHSASYRKYCGTPPLNLLFGMQAALDLIFNEGLDAVQARHALLASAVHAAVEGWREGGAVDFFARDPATRSVSVTTVTLAEPVDALALRTLARERFQVAVAGGLGPLQARAFRIGHLGDCNAAMILGALGGIEAALISMGVPVGAGGVQRAVRALAAG